MNDTRVVLYANGYVLHITELVALQINNMYFNELAERTARERTTLSFICKSDGKNGRKKKVGNDNFYLTFYVRSFQRQ